MSTGRSTAVQTRLRVAIRAKRQPCALCGNDIDYSLRTPDPNSFEVDHIIPLDRGGTDTVANCQASHRRCNRLKWNRLDTDGITQPEAITTTRIWWTQGEAPPAPRRTDPAA